MVLIIIKSENCSYTGDLPNDSVRELVTDESESFGRVADAFDGFVEGLRQSGLQHGPPDLGVPVAHRIIPNGQFGALHFRHAVVQTHFLPDPVKHPTKAQSIKFIS